MLSFIVKTNRNMKAYLCEKVIFLVNTDTYLYTAVLISYEFHSSSGELEK